MQAWICEKVTLSFIYVTGLTVLHCQCTSYTNSIVSLAYLKSMFISVTSYLKGRVPGSTSFHGLKLNSSIIPGQSVTAAGYGILKIAMTFLW